MIIKDTKKKVRKMSSGKWLLSSIEYWRKWINSLLKWYKMKGNGLSFLSPRWNATLMRRLTEQKWVFLLPFPFLSPNYLLINLKKVNNFEIYTGLEFIGPYHNLNNGCSSFFFFGGNDFILSPCLALLFLASTFFKPLKRIKFLKIEELGKITSRCPL